MQITNNKIAFLALVVLALSLFLNIYLLNFFGLGSITGKTSSSTGIISLEIEEVPSVVPSVAPVVYGKTGVTRNLTIVGFVIDSGEVFKIGELNIYNFKIREGGSLIFTLKGIEYTFSLDKVFDTSIIFSIFFPLQSRNLFVGESVQLDVDKDGLLDLDVQLGKVVGGTAEVTLTAIEERFGFVESPLRIETCDDKLKNQNEEGVDCGGICKPCTIFEGKEIERGATFLFIVEVLLFICAVLLVISFISLKKKKKK